MPELFDLLSPRAGHYAGEGKDHDGEIFRGKLILDTIAPAGDPLIRFIALGPDGSLYGRQESVLRVDETGEIVMEMERGEEITTRYRFRREEAADGSFRAFVFGHGELGDSRIRREEIAIELWDDGRIGYRHGWGMPGEEITTRYSLRMTRLA